MTDLDRVLELVVKRSRALIDARAAEIALLDGDEFVIAAAGGRGRRAGDRAAHADRGVGGRRRGDVRRPHAAARTTCPAARFAGRELGAATALVVADGVPQPPVGLPHARSTGCRRSGSFTEEDERLLQAFAASAATAVATAQTASDEALAPQHRRPRRQERRRWARELHDETLQELAGLQRAALRRAAQRRPGAHPRGASTVPSSCITTASPTCAR